jgi:hypothetical protein
MDTRCDWHTLIIVHGRLDPYGPATDLEGNEIEDWGFDGPRLEGVCGISFTYNTFSLTFVDEESYKRAKALAGWKDGVGGQDLEMEFVGDCLQVWNEERGRHEYFGDWSLGDWSKVK